MDAGEETQINLRDYLRVIWRRRWLIALIFALVTGAAFGLSSLQTPVYAASAKVFIGPRSVQSGDVTTALQELDLSGQFVASYAELLSSRTLAEQVVEKNGLSLLPTDLVRHISANVVRDTRIIEVTVTDSSAARAQLIVNSLVDTFVSDAYRQLTGDTGVRATVMESALRPSAPVSPKPLQDGVFGGLLGLMLGIAAAFLIERMDTRLRGIDEVQAALSPLPVLAMIPLDKSNGTKRGIYVERDARSAVSEAFRMLRASVQFLGVERPIRTLLITSSGADEGKTTVVANLASMIALAGLKVVVVESDLRRPVIHEHFDVPQFPGLTDVLVGEVDVQHAIHWSRDGNIGVLPSGHIPPNPSELLGSERMREVLQKVSIEADLTILDTPPVLPVVDASALAPMVDGVIVVIRSGQTHRDRARRTIDNLARSGVRVLGIALNGVTSGPGYSYYYDRYHSDGDGSSRANGKASAPGPTMASRSVDVQPGDSVPRNSALLSPGLSVPKSSATDTPAGDS